MGTAAAGADPDQLVAPQRLAPRATAEFRRQREIDRAGLQFGQQQRGILADQRDANGREGAAEAAQDRRRVAADDVVGRAEPHLALDRRQLQRRPDLVVRRNEMAGYGEQVSSLRRQRHALSGAGEQRLAGQLFQPLELLADGALRAVEAASGAGDAAGLRYRQKRSNDADIDVPLHDAAY